jgi:hypothetical protein
VASPSDPRRPVDVHADVPRPRQHRFARVESHPDPNVDRLRPDVGRNGALCLNRTEHRIDGPWKGNEERVALSVDLEPVPFGEGATEDAALLGQHRRVLAAQPLEQPRRALDVGEQEGDRPARGDAARGQIAARVQAISY